jgi:hypothetical protein
LKEESKVEDTGSLGAREQESLFRGYRVSVWDDEKVLK